MNITFNTEKNGIEIRFKAKPSADVLDMLKTSGFRWSGKQKMWYAKNTPERVKMLESFDLVQSEPVVKSLSRIAAPRGSVVDLWKLTRISDDVNNVDKALSRKEIAANIRKHVRQRFPFCKFSVTSGGWHTISVDLLASPFPKGSKELDAIIHYVYKYAESFNYCTCFDPYGDYGSSYNFYGVYENGILSGRYEQVDSLENVAAVSSQFMKELEQFELEEEARREREHQEQLAQRETEREEAAKREAIRRENHDLIESGAAVSDCDYTVVNCYTTNTRKEDSISGYFDDCGGEYEITYQRETCHVAREVRFFAEAYDLFSNHLLDDYSFLTGMGGSRTDDLRINSSVDYQNMNEAERKTVEWYNCNCVAVYREGELQLVIDPQGYNYARYTYFVDDSSEIVKDYKGSMGISAEEAEQNHNSAESLEDVSAEVIIKNNLVGIWNTEEFDTYKRLILESIEKYSIRFNAAVIQAITDNDDLKAAMYKLLREYGGIQHQFARAGFEYDQKITVISISDFGGISCSHSKFKSAESGKYAQYDDAVKLVCRPKGKRQDYYKWLYRDLLIYDGWIDVPENLLFDTWDSNGITVKKGKFMGFDKSQYDVVLDYFAERGIYPIVNTYKPGV